jgi:glycosyltransferase involved in cell wall biosynthesis
MAQIRPIIHAYILCWNEEDILPFTLDHYERYCEKIYLLDNMSDDKSLSIAREYGAVTVLQWDSGGKIRDDLYVHLKNHAYKRSRGQADFVIVCDADEIYLGLDALVSSSVNYSPSPSVHGYQMVSSCFPKYRGKDFPITKLIQTGCRDFEFDKPCVFDPELDVEFSFGAHKARFSKPTSGEQANLTLLHYKYLGINYFHSKNLRARARLSNLNLAKGLGIHYHDSIDKSEENYMQCLRQTVDLSDLFEKIPNSVINKKKVVK